MWLIASNAKLALWLVLAMPVVWITTQVFHTLGFPAYRRIRETHSAISAQVAEAITGVRVVQAFGQEGRELSELENRQGLYRAAVLRGARVAAAYIPSLSLTFHARAGRDARPGRNGRRCRHHDRRRTARVHPAARLRARSGGGSGRALQRVAWSRARPRSASSSCSTRSLRSRTGRARSTRAACEGDIVYEDVSFAYDPEATHGWQLEDVTFRVEPGQTVAIVGHTGAGKTSVINLLARFYEAQKGVVRLDGHDIRDLTLDSLHRQTGIVLQSNFLFAGCVLENLRFVSPGLTEKDALRGFAELGCGDILDQLQAGLETDVGERGANLSEGERQIVCFVRALLADPSILILDEATSAVDTRTEALILQALRRLSSRQTTLVIAHRLSTIRDADRILVMKDGSVVEQGTHEELLARGGVYTDLYRDYAA